MGRGHIGLGFGVTQRFCLVCAKSYETIFIWGAYFILLLFCTQSDEGSCFLDTFENVCHNIRPTSTYIGE